MFKRLRDFCLILLILSFFVCLSHAISVATVDDFRAPFYNPAAISFGNAAGIGFQTYYNQDDSDLNHYHLIFNSNKLSFVYGKYDVFDSYQLSLSQEVFRNFYFGSDITWSNSDIDNALYRISFLSRPSNNVSLGVVIHELNSSDPMFKLGIGIKPPMLSKSNKLIVTADFDYSRGVNSSYSFTEQTIGMQTQLIEGLSLSGYYGIESQTVGLNFSLTNRSLKLGGENVYDRDKNVSYSKYYVNISQREYPQLPFFSGPEKVFELELKKPIVEKPQQTQIGPFVLIGNELPIRDIVSQINKLKEDERVKGIIIKEPQFSSSYANVEQLNRTFNTFRDEGKSIIVYSGNYGNLNYAFLASIADELFLNPNGSVMLQGFSVTVPYFKNLLDEIGIDVYDLKSHDYKTSMNIFTEDKMTEEEKETYQSLLDVYYDKMVDLIDKGRGNRLKRPIEQIIDEGPYLNSEQALNIGLVDKLVYEDEFDDIVKSYFDNPRITKTMPDEFIKYEWSNPREKNVALIYAIGGIHQGEGRPGHSIGAKTLARQLKKARQNKSIEGIIIRVDSGGGSAHASDLIAREVKLSQEAGKPVIISMGGAAASGGYYIAAPAEKIIAENTTITGSIGVTGMITNFHRLSDKLHINWETVKRGENADLLSVFQEVKDEDLEIMLEHIDQIYDRFVDLVAIGRDSSYEEIHQLAQGRIWTGADAKQHGLIDDIGGLDTAIVAMREILNFDNLKLVNYSHSYKKIPVNIDHSNLIKFMSPQEILMIDKNLLQYRNYINSFENDNIQYKMRLFDVKGIE